MYNQTKTTLKLAPKNENPTHKRKLVRLWFVSVHVKVSCRLRKLQPHPFQVLLQHYLAAEAGVFAQKRCHIEQIVLLLLRLGQTIEVLVLHVHVTGGAGQRGLAGALHLDTEPMGQVQYVIAHLAPNRRLLAILIDVRNVYAEKISRHRNEFGTVEKM